ncbi:CMD domain-containing protein [Falsiroseomonas oryzae]|uniref:CMD domain-containing protein n=1 Tax=Falsiroseomonas oryzae TaxID=2766473 RepID=UPI0022EAC5C1|nr:hypothetical protein [Roseomonas sp. MO-31]
MPDDEDLIDSLLGTTPDSPLGVLRRRRPEALRHAQGAYRELVLPADPGGLSHAERAVLALRVALREGDAALSARYRAVLEAAGGGAMAAAAEAPGTPGGQDRVSALLRYADRVAMAPDSTSKADIEGLTALGFTPRDIVATTQLVAFVPYQVRVLAALRAMLQESRA